jgi:hypothetical protein
MQQFHKIWNEMVLRRKSSSPARIVTALSVALALVAFLLAAPPLVGQTVSGTVSGTVTDPTGAIVPGAAVTVKNTDTGEIRRTGVSNSCRLLLDPRPPSWTHIRWIREGQGIPGGDFLPHRLRRVRHSPST